ncbi:Conserved oligomeric Golgi complex subunit 2 [Tritrichomonas musculus]|uniref:Conserved oligomeric Golgi complex subunit 2 n=1 Tax=Tritrichomonas musculus TaxID=1915356 RepID=A0ABR2HWA5_9EUKA
MISWKLTDFIEPSWTSPDDFLTKYKDNFEDLRSFAASLDQFTETLKSQLTSIIHDDYTEFVSISKQLLQLGDTMGSLLKSLQSAEKSVEKASSTLEESTQPIKVHSEKLHNVRHEYATCTLALGAIEQLQMIESQLNQVDNNIYKLLDISIGFAVTKAKLIGLDQPSEQKPIETEYDRIYESYKNIIKFKFFEFLEKRQKDNLLAIFNASIMSGLHDYLQLSFCELVSKNLLSPLDSQKSKRSGNASIVLNSFIKYLQDANNEFNYLISISPDVFDFALNSVWPTLSSWMDNYLSFSIGDPEEQMNSYHQLSLFFDLCESKCKSIESILSVRNSQIRTKIQSKLRLDIYTQLISNQILSNAEKIFSSQIEANGKKFFLSFTEEFLKLYNQIFSDKIFIIEQSKDFAVIAMKLISSLNNFASNASQQNIPYFVADLKNLMPMLLQSTPEFLQNAMKIAIDSIQITADQIRQTLIAYVSEICIKHLAYIGKMTAVVTKRNVKPSDEAVATINTFFEWAKNTKNACSDIEFLTTIVSKIFDEFLVQSTNQLSSLRKTFDTIMKFRKSKSPTSPTKEDQDQQAKPNMFKIDVVQKQLKTDIDYIANVSRGKNVPVDSFPAYNQINELLNKDFSDDLNAQ